MLNGVKKGIYKCKQIQSNYSTMHKKRGGIFICIVTGNAKALCD